MPRYKNYEIKTGISLDGEKEFREGLAQANRVMRLMDSELLKLRDDFNITGDEQRVFTERSEILADKVKQQTAIVAALEKEVQIAAEKYGIASKEVYKWQTELNNAERKLWNVAEQSRRANQELENLGKTDPEMEFLKAMDEANRSMRLYQSEAKLLGVTYRNNGQNADFLAKKSENLKEQIAAAEKIYVETAEAMKRSAAATGELSEETVNLKIRTNEARIELTNLRRESEQVDRDLEELGRDSGKIGRQIERGIGDAAEDTADKLDGMFAKVAKDVNALKSSVAFQTTMEIGGFVMDSIQSVVGFVQENDEYNRQIAITKYNIEKYGHNWDDALDLVIDAAAITANREGAFEAISNLASSGVQEQALMEAAVDALLGVFITTGGALSFESLAEDFRASVVSRVPTGTYAEVLEELLQGIVLEDVEKALGEMKTVDEAFQLALSYLTKGGYQTTTRNLEEQNQEFLEAQRKQEELAGAWAALALELQPVVTDLTTALTTAVENVTDWVDWAGDVADKYGDTIASLIDTTLEKIIPGYTIAIGTAKTVGSLLSGKAKMNYDLFNQAYEEYFGKQSPLQSFFEWIIPSAGAKTLPGGDPNEAGFLTMQQYVQGLQEAADAEVTAAQAAVATTIAEMQTEEQLTDAFEAGKNAMIAFGNGIAEAAPIPINNVATMVNQINTLLSQIATPAFGLGWSGISGGNVYLYNQQKSVANAVSKAIGAGAQRLRVTK